MAEVLRIGSIVIFFYSADLHERMHVHVRQRRNEVKYWIEPEIEYANHVRGSFADHELTKIEHLLKQNMATIVQKWYEEAQKL
ncbi:MAG: DUF4160 domain-containing protein [Caldilineaceae bacterium]|nr:DUF4160 domain-containing protein [Caldilineaceae bacterium]